MDSLRLPNCPLSLPNSDSQNVLLQSCWSLGHLLLRSEAEHLLCLTSHCHVLVPLYFRPIQGLEHRYAVRGYKWRVSLLLHFDILYFKILTPPGHTCWKVFALDTDASTFSFSSTHFHPVSTPTHLPKLLSHLHSTSSNRTFLAWSSLTSQSF